jgi:hypothetical protein
MANQIILPPQKFKFADLINQFPSSRKLIKKVFFQAELRSLANDNASFAVIAYPGWKTARGKWVIGKKIEGEITGEGKHIPFVSPLAFANNELLLAATPLKKEKKSKKKDKKCKEDDFKKSPGHKFLQLVKKISKDKKLIQKSFFLFESRISENPHIEYDVTLNADGVTLNVSTKPSPPARPEEADAEA